MRVFPRSQYFLPFLIFFSSPILTQTTLEKMPTRMNYPHTTFSSFFFGKTVREIRGIAETSPYIFSFYLGTSGFKIYLFNAKNKALFQKTTKHDPIFSIQKKLHTLYSIQPVVLTQVLSRAAMYHVTLSSLPFRFVSSLIRNSSPLPYLPIA